MDSGISYVMIIGDGKRLLWCVRRLGTLQELYQHTKVLSLDTVEVLFSLMMLSVDDMTVLCCHAAMLDCIHVVATSIKLLVLHAQMTEMEMSDWLVGVALT
jgi:hypothetical protein